MAPFKFRLEQVLAYRKQLEEQAMQELGAAIKRQEEIVQRMHEITAELDQLRMRIADFASLETGDRYVLLTYEKALKEERKMLQNALFQQEREVERCRQVLIVKAQERSLLDKLKEKQAKRHTEQELFHEQRTNDETATLRFRPPSY